MASINITVDGVDRSVESDQRPTHIFAEDKSIVVARVNGELRDLWSELKDGDVVDGVAISSPDGLSVLRHSTAHVLYRSQRMLRPHLRYWRPLRPHLPNHARKNRMRPRREPQADFNPALYATPFHTLGLSGHRRPSCTGRPAR